jgi:hypothetical protein
VAMETNNPEHLGALRRRGLEANEDRRRGLPRCPVCFIIRDAMPKEFTCRLSRFLAYSSTCSRPPDRCRLPTSAHEGPQGRCACFSRMASDAADASAIF